MSVEVDMKEWKPWKPSKALLKEVNQTIKQLEKQEIVKKYSLKKEEGKESLTFEGV